MFCQASSLLDDQPPRCLGIFHGLPVELFGFVELQTEIDQTERWYHPNSKAYPPRGSQMAFRAGEHHNHRNEARGKNPNVDLDVREHDEPPIPMPLLQFPRTFSACDATGGIFATASLLAI